MRRISYVAMFGLAAAMLPACGGSSASSSGRVPATSVSQHAASGSPIQIGMPVSLSGYIQALDSPLLKGAELAVASINASGGIHGHPLKLVPEDIASSPSQGVSVTERLINQGNISALIMGYSSATAAAVAPLVAGKKIPVITASVLPTADQWEFSTIPPTSLSSALAAQYAQSIKAKTMGIVYGETPYGEEAAKTLAAAAAKDGIAVTGKAVVPPSATDLTAELAKLKSAGIIADALTGPAHVAEANAAKTLGLSSEIVMNIDARSTIEQATQIYPGTQFVAAPLQVYPNVAQSTVKAQDAALIAKYGTGAGLSYAGVGWDAVHILASAMEAAGSPTSGNGLRAALETVSYTGTEAVYKFTSADHDGVQTDPYVIAHCQAGGCTVTYPTKAA